MDNRWKNAIYSVLLLTAMYLVWKWRNPEIPTEPIRIEGETMATTYHITYFDSQQRNFKTEVDSLFVLINQSINNYNPNSEVSLFNRSAGFRFHLPYLYAPIKVAKQVYADSQGAFDPTVMPLVNLWGFGQQKVSRPDSTKIDSIRSFIGFNKIKFSEDSIWKLDPRVQLDFGGIGQGYGADVITDFLKAKGIKNMLVELGGEGMAVGKNLQSGNPWELGILDPNSTNDNQFFKAYVSLSDKSFTTSGNYFNYREVDGKKYSHTIDPFTGYPATRAILSASVFADDATTADAWGTAFMVMGHEKAIVLLKNHPEIDAFLIYSTPDGLATFATEKISAQLKVNP
jgi:thiamine biosynthesis lipoprotein